MPWCEPCDKWRSPGALLPDGTCPRCRTQVDKGTLAVEVEHKAAHRQAQAKIPWHFWLMVASAALYLAWRAIQGVAALF